MSLIEKSDKLGFPYKEVLSECNKEAVHQYLADHDLGLGRYVTIVNHDPKDLPSPVIASIVEVFDTSTGNPMSELHVINSGTGAINLEMHVLPTEAERSEYYNNNWRIRPYVGIEGIPCGTKLSNSEVTECLEQLTFYTEIINDNTTFDDIHVATRNYVIENE